MMLATRGRHCLQRAARVHPSRINRAIPRARFASTDAAPSTAGGASGAVTGGLIGGGVALGVTYAWYYFSGASTAVQTAKQAKGYFDTATNSLKVKFEEKTPDTNQALQTLKESATKYAAFVPGGKAYVDSAFNDLETIRKKHGPEVDEIVSEAYGELRDASKKGLSLETASDAYNVMSKHLQRLFSLAGDAADDILQNHPQLKEKLGGSADQLKQLGQRLGPEAKKQIDETWEEVRNILQKGLQIDNIERARSLLQDKTEKFKKLADDAFDQGWEQVKPMLEKSPAVKQFVEQNMETLKQGNTAELVNQVRSAISSGNVQDLQKYAEQIKGKAQQYSGGHLSDWLKSIPNGDQIMPQLQKLWEIVEKEGSQAKEIAEGTVSDIKQVLDKRMSEIDKLSKE